MKSSLIWLAVLVTLAAIAWAAPHSFSGVLVIWAWLFGSLWGYFTAYGEMKK